MSDIPADLAAVYLASDSRLTPPPAGPGMGPPGGPRLPPISSPAARARLEA